MVIARAASQAMRWSSRVVSIEVLIESWCGDALLLTGDGLVYLRSEVDAVKARTRALDAHEDAIGQTGRELARERELVCVFVFLFVVVCGVVLFLFFFFFFFVCFFFS